MSLSLNTTRFAMLSWIKLSWTCVLFFGLVQYTIATNQREKRANSVCYPSLGCYDSKYPFDNAFGDVPDPPNKIQTKFRLHTRQNDPNFDVLDYLDNDSISKSSFSPSKKTCFIIHGFNSNSDKDHVQDMKDALLTKGDFNVILVDWSKGAAIPHYNQASANLRLVAMETKLLLDFMAVTGLDVAKVHLIGHSLGAHMAGAIGNLTGGKIGRISGLDPAEPNFENTPTVVRLDAGDAVFVDVIHTDSNGYDIINGGFGLKQPSGDLDIYANGGELQPGCAGSTSGLVDHVLHSDDLTEGLSVSVACSHNRAQAYFTESINSLCTFKSYPCPSYDRFEQGSCLACGANDDCGSLGYLADTLPARGIHYVNTLPQEPFCGKAYGLVVTPSHDQISNNHGTIFMTLAGEKGIGDFSQITERKGKLSNKNAILHVAAFTDVGKPKSLQVKFVMSDRHFVTVKKHFTIDSIQLKDPVTDILYTTCEGAYKLTSESVQDIPLSETCTPIG